MRPPFIRGAIAALVFTGAALGAGQPSQPEAPEPVTIATVVAKDLDLSPEQVRDLRRKKFDLGRGSLAIDGYDPVAYFPEGGGTPTKGDRKITHEHNGVVYRFASEKHRDLFKDNPEKYEPAYGGWCAYAMAKSDYTGANPKRFLIQNGRLLLFYDGLLGDTYKSWQKEGPEKLEPVADKFWTDEVTKEAKRLKG